MKQPHFRQFPGSGRPESRSPGVPVRPVPGWRLPSGQLLVEYALRAGFVSSPLLLRWPLVTPELAEAEVSSLLRLENAVGRESSTAAAESRPARKRTATRAAVAEGN
jgi:hypothetical protein